MPTFEMFRQFRVRQQAQVIEGERIHALDSLRGIMMLLGIVLHSTEIYLVGDNPPFPKDSNSTHLALNYLEYLIHMFRMPVFFLLAGFFGSMLFYLKGTTQMIRNRIRRILLPFFGFLIILYPIIIVTLRSAEQVFAGGSFEIFFTIEDFIPYSTLHLWFLYYLILCTGLTLLFNVTLKRLPKTKQIILNNFKRVVGNPLSRNLFGTLFIFMLLLILWDLTPPVPLSFVPVFSSLLFYLFEVGI